MSDNIQLNAEPRADSGKGASRRLRRTGLVPAVVYGGDGAPRSISLVHNEFNHELENEAIYCFCQRSGNRYDSTFSRS